jgi:hypothetical protein
VSFATIALYVAQRVFILVSVYFVTTQSGNFWIHPRITILIFQGLGLLAYSGSEFIFLKLMNLFGQLVGLLGRGISPTQGLYLHRITKHRKTRTHPCLEWNSNPQSQCSSGRRPYMPQTARPLGSTPRNIYIYFFYFFIF